MAQGDTGSPTEPTSVLSKSQKSSNNDDAIWQTKRARLLERFLPDSLRSASPEERSQARILTGMLLVMLGGSVLVVAGQVVNGTAFGFKLGLAIAGGWTAFLIAIRAGVRIRTLSQSVLAYIYLVSVGVTIASGGGRQPLPYSSHVFSRFLLLSWKGQAGQRAGRSRYWLAWD